MKISQNFKCLKICSRIYTSSSKEVHIIYCRLNTFLVLGVNVLNGRNVTVLEAEF